MKRRTFLKTSLATAVGALTIPAAKSRAESTPSVKQYRKLGKTGLKMSDISFGAGKLASASMVLRAIDMGINYFDTAPDYGDSEELIGKAMKRIQRDKIIIASKFCDPKIYPAHLGATAKKKAYITAVEGSLKRMKTDYLDFAHVHAIGEQSRMLKPEEHRLQNDELLGAVAELKKAGKIRFLAASSHGPSNMEQLMMTAVKSGHYDLIMPAFNFMKFPKVPDVLKEAHKRGVGVVAMKTLAGARDMNLDDQIKERPYKPAVLKWVLKHLEVSGLVISIKTIEDLELYLKASGQKFTAADQRVLDRYAALHGRDYCRTGCGECEASCPDGVEIGNILRYQMYFENYGQEKHALQLYSKTKQNAEICLSCTTCGCSGSCPHDLPVQSKLQKAHRTLSLF